MENKLLAFKRTEGKNNSSYSLKDSYKLYKKSSDKPVSFKMYKDIHARCADVEFEKLLKGEVLHLPIKLGTLKIVKKKSKIQELPGGITILSSYRVDWKATKLYWLEKYPTLSKEELLEIKNKPVIYHKNENTDGHVLEVEWNTRGVFLKNKYFRRLTLVRQRNKQLKKFVSSNEFKYIEYPEKLKKYESRI